MLLSLIFVWTVFLSGFPSHLHATQSLSKAQHSIELSSVNTTLDATVIFTCKASSPFNALTFYVNGKAVADGVEGFCEEKEIFFNASTNKHTRNLIAIAYERHNDTVVNCTAFSTDNGSISTTAKLMIQGLLASVSDLSATILNGGSSVLLTWTAPYTLDSVLICGYLINGQLVNSTDTVLPSTNDHISSCSSADLNINSSFVTITDTSLSSHDSRLDLSARTYVDINIESCSLVNSTSANTVLYSTDDPVDPCAINTAVVSAVNGAGVGQPANISFYYQRVPQSNLTKVKVTPSICRDKQVLLQVNTDVSQLCPGEYPSNVMVYILDTDNNIQVTTSLPVSNGQLMDSLAIAVPDNLSAFIVNVSLSNRGGVFPLTSPFSFGFLGPVLNVKSTVDNCTTITVTWDRPTVDEIVPILYYTLKIYDATNGMLVSTVSSIEETSYQFEDQELFRHRYTYVIAAVNELGEGETANGTFSYQKAPRSALRSSVSVNIQGNRHVAFTIPIIVNCTGEAPESAIVTVQCGDTDISTFVSPVSYTSNTVDITGIALLTEDQCTLNIIFSNAAGQSSSLIIELDSNASAHAVPHCSYHFWDIFAFGAVCVLALTLLILLVLSVSFAANQERRRSQRQNAFASDSIRTSDTHEADASQSPQTQPADGSNTDTPDTHEADASQSPQTQPADGSNSGESTSM